MTNKKTITTFTLLSTTILALGLIFAPSVQTAMAGDEIILHGLGVQKGCAKVLVGDNLDCIITATNTDTGGDTITITDVCDDVAGQGELCMAPGASNGFSVVSVSGGATCANGNTEVPCSLPGVVGPSDGAVVVFASTGFTLNIPGFTDDDARVDWNDACDVGEGACNDSPQTSDAPASTFVANPDISVTKEPHPKASSGDDIDVFVTITNEGNVELTEVRANDSEAGELNCDEFSLGPGDTTDCTGSFGPVTVGGINLVTAFGDFQLETYEAEAEQSFTVADPALSVVKECTPTTQSAPGTITWEIWVSNDGNVDLDVLVDDTRFGVIFDGTISADDSIHVDVTESDLVVGTYVNTVTATADFQLEDLEVSATATCVVTGGSEGLTPGFWKANAEKWVAVAWAIEDPEDSFNSVFGTTVELRLAKGNADTDKGTSDNPTLFGALGARGGDENALARHCVAAKLNAEEGHIDYFLSTDEVIEQCADALNGGDSDEINDLKDLLDEQNNLGADISQHHEGSS